MDSSNVDSLGSEPIPIEKRDPSKFCSLANLLSEERLQPGTIATAVEEDGVYGFDRFGRFKHFKRDSEEAKAALNALACQFEWQLEADDERDPDSPAENDEGLGVFSRYGWHIGDLPQFAESEEDPLRVVNMPRRSKGVNADRRLIAALVALIQGLVPRAPNPGKYRDKAHIVSTILSAFPDVDGLGESTLFKKFGEAESLLRSEMLNSPDLNK